MILGTINKTPKFKKSVIGFSKIIHVIRASFIIAFSAVTAAAATPVSATYWNIFSAVTNHTLQTCFVTYATIYDMMNDTNRLNSVIATGNGAFDHNIVGSGTDSFLSVVPSVPEPATWAMFLLGFAAVGAVQRKKVATSLAVKTA